MTNREMLSQLQGLVGSQAMGSKGPILTGLKFHFVHIPDFFRAQSKQTKNPLN